MNTSSNPTTPVFKDPVLAFIATFEPRLLTGVDPTTPLTQIVRTIGEDTYVEMAARAGIGDAVCLETEPPDPSVKERLGQNVAAAHHCIPYKEENGKLHVVFGYPTLSSINAVAQMLPQPMKVLVSKPSSVERAIHELYGLRSHSAASRPLAHSAASTPPRTPEDRGATADSDSSKAALLLTHIIKEAVRMGVSDIHFHRNGEGEVLIRFRNDGELQNVPRIQSLFEKLRVEHFQEGEEDDLGNRLVNHVMVKSHMDVADLTKPHDGSFAIELQPGDEASIVQTRVLALPSIYGHTVTIRLLPREQDIIPLEKQGFSPVDLEHFKEALEKGQGMILVTGPTGSGKSTTLAAALDVLRRKGNLNIITVEDPVEFRYKEGITQIDVSRSTFDFAESLRAILRADPDVIELGEIRDEETARIATQAANTGHLVLSTLHTNNATLAISRLELMGVPRYMLADNLLVVVGQRLLPRLCPHCRVPAGPPDRERLIAMGLEETANDPLLTDTVVYSRGAGCQFCNNTGVKGRVAIHEVYVNTPRLKNLIIKGASNETIRREARNEGMVTMKEAATQAYLSGEIDLRTVMRVGDDE